ncbi:MAG: hypothetical protein ABR541_08425 [Candidatus Dormibacteria bacterium]
MALDHARRQLPVRALVFSTVLAGVAGLGLSGTGEVPTVTGRHVAAARPLAAFAARAGAPGRLDVASSPASDPVAAPAPAAPAQPAIAPPAGPAPAPMAPVHAAPPAPAPAPAPAPTFRSRLVSQDGSLNTGVGYYGDCSGRTPLTRGSAAIDGCIGGRLFFVGHNPGVFTPLMHMGVGSIITWWDGGGTAHRLRIVAVRQWVHSGLPPFPVNGGTVQFQTCITADGSLDRLLDAAPA